ncbi:unnamed protein product [Arctogadus glacialis]
MAADHSMCQCKLCMFRHRNIMAVLTKDKHRTRQLIDEILLYCTWEPTRALRRDDSTNVDINHWWTLLLYSNTRSSTTAGRYHSKRHHRRTQDSPAMWWDYDIIQGDVAAGYQRFIDVLLPLEPWERRERRERGERGTRQRTRPGSVSEAGQAPPDTGATELN